VTTLRSFFIAMTRNPISLVGAAITTAAAIVTGSLFAVELLGHHGSPYMGIIAYLIVPAIFVVGLLLIPVGIMRERLRERRAEAAGQPPAAFPVIDLNETPTRTRALLFVVLSAANVVILATATYKGVEVMDSTPFCGAACHSVMAPEYTAYQRSPHARVKCVSCHIGPGAGWFVKSKLSGAWQVVAVTFDLYPRPIPTPVENLRPARETCEQCHWPTKFVGDRLKVITHYENDADNTETKTVLLLRVGGVQGRKSEGIHWHVDPGNRIRYRSDASRETIYEIELTLPDGTVKRFKTADAPEDDGSAESWRVMDCVDCHNRPSHVYRLPEQEVDQAILAGGIPRSLPFVRREGVRLLRGDYASHDAASAAIRDGLAAFYQENDPAVADGQAAQIDAAATRLGQLYASNVWPSMNIHWGTYPNHIGHEQSDGCFRCHDELHETEDGETISQDCSTCHSLLAMEEVDPAILQELNP